MNNGWIKLHRKMNDWEWYKDLKVFKVFLHLLLNANHEDKKWMGIIIHPGQRITSYRHMSKELGLGVQSIRTALEKLKSTHEITLKKTNKYSVITILNWNQYQTPTHNLTNNQHTTNIQLTTNKKYKNVRSNMSPDADSNKKSMIINIDENGEVIPDKELPKKKISSLVHAIGYDYCRIAYNMLAKMKKPLPENRLLLREGSGKMLTERIKNYGAKEVAHRLGLYVQSEKFLQYPRLTSAISGDTFFKIETKELK